MKSLNAEFLFYNFDKLYIAKDTYGFRFGNSSDYPFSSYFSNSMQQPPFVQGAPRSERRWMGSFAFAGIPQLKHRARHRGIYGTQFNTKP